MMACGIQGPQHADLQRMQFDIRLRRGLDQMHCIDVPDLDASLAVDMLLNVASARPRFLWITTGRSASEEPSQPSPQRSQHHLLFLMILRFRTEPTWVVSLPCAC